ncbi:TrbC/VirB2 family protein [Paraburkholderia domus]|uniref:TrbC/VirB2 family protein n=1 Tax=Paraburkholderia domus TaxID=2793075 RepID=UPI0019142BDD|nr:TrbC/VirB2 family protein [Paraburkholderia domus]MBK5065786.1 TrbC/VirB2 family protein [Burkholderia sp. R-70199]CAE6963099.1 hypothetical protein R70199_07473 [Paraburkholderia domus]
MRPLKNALRSLYRNYLSPKELVTTLVALVLSFLSPLSMADSSSTNISDLSTASGIICMISDYISGPWLYGIGIVLIIVGAVAISSSESSISKMISTVFVGLGIAACAVNIVKNHLGLSYTC